MKNLKDINVELLKEVIQLAQIRSEYHNQYSLKSGSMEEFAEYQKSDDYKKVKEKDDKLKDFFNKISFEDIKWIQTIMYIGRDAQDGEAIPEMLFQQYYADFEQRGWESKTIETSQITQKLPLADYLIRGRELLNI